MHASPNRRVASWVASAAQLENAALLAASLALQGGAWGKEPLDLYVDPSWSAADRVPLPPHCRLRPAPGAPPEAEGLGFAGKPAAAARAEEEAGREGVRWLAWLDDDSLLLGPPDPFDLPPAAQVGFRPVMHLNVAPRADQPVDAWWERIWELEDVQEHQRFVLNTVADGDPVRCYVNAGCLVARPEAGLLGAWAGAFARAAADARLRALTMQDPRRILFLHQALLGAALAARTGPAQRMELPASLNWPLLFGEMFKSRKEFHDLTGVLSLRHEGFLLHPREDWLERLGGPAETLRELRRLADRAWRVQPALP